jgi:hypothetical protein
MKKKVIDVVSNLKSYLIFGAERKNARKAK